MGTGHGSDWYADHLLSDVDLIARAFEVGPADAPIEACDGWDVAKLVRHLGMVQRWATSCIANAAAPDGMRQFAPGDGDDLAAWLRAGAIELASVLRAVDPAAPTWHPFPVDQVAGVWPRRQAQEAVVHRWDAQHAIGAETPIDADLASDGIDEYFELVIARRVARDAVALPSGSLHVHCTDVAGEWLVDIDDQGAYRLVRAHQKGDAALRGPAEVVLLRLWGRATPRVGELDVVGDASVVDAWLTIAGM